MIQTLSSPALTFLILLSQPQQVESFVVGFATGCRSTSPRLITNGNAYLSQLSSTKRSWLGLPPAYSSFRKSRTTTQLYDIDNKVVYIMNMDDDNDDDQANNEQVDDDDEDDEPETEDPYTTVASSEFVSERPKENSGNSLMFPSSDPLSTNLDWGGALGKLRQRLDDIESGKAGNPSQALFRLMSAESPNQSIGSFISSANPQVIQAMSGAVSSLLGGLSNPQSGVEVLVKTTGDRIGSLCFQLQMTGYMFRNVEYVMALRKLMKLRGTATLQDYKDAFDRLDTDNNGFIEIDEIAALLDDVYDGKTPSYEINSFIRFFDQNNDGKVSWEEFEQGVGAALVSQAFEKSTLHNLLPESNEDDDDDDDDDDDIPELEQEVNGKIMIEMDNGKEVEVDAQEYIENLKAEAKALKNAILERNGSRKPPNMSRGLITQASNEEDQFGSIAQYISSRQGDLKSLTEGISPEIVATMKMLVDYVLVGGDSRKGKDMPKEKMEMEIPGSALQQLALWQLVLGYRLREAEAKGDYLKLLE